MICFVCSRTEAGEERRDSAYMGRMRTALFLVFLASVLGVHSARAEAQQGGAVPIVTGTASYISGTIPDEEAVSLRVRGDGAFPGPVLTLIDEAGVESDCLLPCTVRTRVGRVAIDGPRLSIDVDLEAAGLTYDVVVTAGSSGDDFALVTTFLVTGGVSLGLGIWGLTLNGGDEDLNTLAAIGAVYGGIAVGISLPWLVVLIATLNGTATVSFSRGLSAALTPEGAAFTF